METPKITVIIPAYHCAATIGQAIRSALRQQVPMEILVLEDCSDEQMESVRQEFAREPVFFLKNEQHLGASGSRNRGAAMAKGEYVAFLDADDWWADGKLKKQLALMEKTGCVLSCTARELVTPDGKQTGKVIPVEGTPMDFRTARRVGDHIDDAWPQLTLAGGYDHNWVLNTEFGKVQKFAQVEDEKAGRTMEVYTDLPGVQFYAGNCITPQKGKDGVSYDKRHALCLETQYFPDSVKISCIL